MHPSSQWAYLVVRLFYSLCQKQIPYPRYYGLRVAPFFHHIRIYSFAFNLWALDTRMIEEKRTDPRVLDVGWTEFDAPTDSEDLRAISTTHLIVEEEKMFRNPGRTQAVS